MRRHANDAECAARSRGKRRAPLPSMYDVDAIEAINLEQIVTRTDRLLLRGGRLPKHRPSSPQLAEQTIIVQRPEPISHLIVVGASALVALALVIATFA